MKGKHSICYQVEAWDILQDLFKIKKINDHTAISGRRSAQPSIRR